MEKSYSMASGFDQGRSCLTDNYSLGMYATDASSTRLKTPCSCFAKGFRGCKKSRGQWPYDKQNQTDYFLRGAGTSLAGHAIGES